MVFLESEIVHVSLRPEDRFSAKLEEIGMKTVGQDTKYQVGYMAFPEDKELIFFGIDKIQIVDNKVKPPDNTPIGKLDASLKKIGINLLYDVDGTGALKTNPDLIGKVLTMTPGRFKTDSEGRKSAQDWYVESIEGLSGSASSQPIAAPTEKTRSLWETFLATNMTEPINAGGIIRLVNAKAPESDRKVLNDTRTVMLAELVKSGFLTLDANGKYSIK